MAAPGGKQAHIWMVHMGRYRCLACRQGMHSGMPWRVIKQMAKGRCAMREEEEQDGCSMTWAADQPRPMKGGMALSKQPFFSMLVDGDWIGDTRHEWHWSSRATGVACEKCGRWLSRAFAWQQVKEILTAACENREQQPRRNVKLHSSHSMVKRPDGWSWAQCGGSMQLKDHKWLLQSALESQRFIGEFFSSSSQGEHKGEPSIEPRPASMECDQPGEMAVDFF